MALSYYDDSESSGDQGSTQGASDHAQDSGKTALVDSSICPGMKPGDEFTVRVEKVLDSGEYVLSYPEGSKKEESSEPPMEENMEPEGSEVGAYMG